MINPIVLTLLAGHPLFHAERKQSKTIVDLTPHKAGIEAARNAQPDICRDPRTAFLAVLDAAGFKSPNVLQIGKLDRIDGIEDKRGKKSGWYVYNEIEDSQNEGSLIGIASYGDWKLGISENWTSRSEHRMSTQERLNYHAKREAMRAAHDLETKQRQAEAAESAYEIWVNAKDAKEHPYLTKKGIKPYKGVKVAKDDRLIVPVAIKGEITSLQFINDEGEKRFLTGGKIKGGWFMIEGENDVVYIAEGYSTAASIHEATGKTIYIAFNAGNIYEVASYVKNQYQTGRIIVAGDDDTKSAGNAGRTKAEQAASGLGIEAVFPAGFNDFNDMHADQGIKAVKKLLLSDSIEAYEKKAKPNNKNEIVRPDGVLGDIVDYYNATSGNRQEGFAVQTALALTSIILGRSYKTSYENFSSLYFINVAKSGTGKEHCKKVVEKILSQANLHRFIAGDGYTSAGAVFSTLLDRPKHIAIIDEFGRYLEAGKNLGGGNHHQREANTKLMEAFGRCDDIIRPPSYSSMTLKKEAAEAIKNRFVHNPAITLVGMTTPDTLFRSLDMGAIKDGFFNRFIVSISDAERDVRKHRQPIDVPENILEWIRVIMERNDMPHMASDPAAPITLDFSEEALKLEFEFQKYTKKDLPNKLEKYGMAELSMRSSEQAMRISLNHCLGRNPYATVIEAQDMEWAIGYVRQGLEKTIETLKITLSHSEHEGYKKEILAALREVGKEGVTWAEMQKTPPYSKHKSRDLKDMLQSLKDADLAADEPYKPEGRGRPSVRWIALK